MPTVGASSFNNFFNDYGKDADSDDLFNYLTIEAEVNIDDPSRDYIIYGLLEDSEGNYIEYNDCKNLTIGKHNFALDFSGTKIYRNQVNGPYNLKYIELSSIDDCNEISEDFPSLPEVEHFLNNAHTTSSYQYREFQKGEAAVDCHSSPCIASLIESRDNINVQEPNAPNTIDGCEDGSSGKYLQDESIENITVTSLSHNFFKIGDEIKVEIWVYCDSPYDKLNFVYTDDIDNIQWTVKDNAECNTIGFQKFSTNFILDNKIGQHAIRGVFSFNLQPNTVCGEDDPHSDWADTDDVVIYVKEECNANNDCSETECDYLDGCYAGTYRDYSSMSNTCTEDFTCTNNLCIEYDNKIITDFDLDGYDIECGNDCDDSNADTNPGAEEICDGIDNNCNGDIDEGFADKDSDGLADCIDTDNDNDGINDKDDFIIGSSNDISTNDCVKFEVNNQEDPKNSNGLGNVILKDCSGKILVEFDYDFTNETVMGLGDINITVNLTSGGSIIIQGINLSSQNRTKAAYIDKILGSNTICIIDEEVASITVTDDCTNGVKVTCDGSNAGYNCTSVGTRYNVTGLTHSAITEYTYTPSTSLASTDTGGGDTGGGGGGGGVSFTCNMDWECGEWSECIDGEQTRTCNFVKVPQQASKTRCPSEDKPPETSRECGVKEETTEEIEEVEPSSIQEPLEEIELEEAKENAFARITGAFLGGGTTSLIGLVIIVVIVGGGLLFFYRKKLFYKR